MVGAMPLIDGGNLMQTRMILDSHYARTFQQGKKMRKTTEHIKKLVDYFNINPTWDYAIKVKIAEEIGMTLNQVSKWNWDHRKKLGFRTSNRALIRRMNRTYF